MTLKRSLVLIALFVIFSPFILFFMAFITLLHAAISVINRDE